MKNMSPANEKATIVAKTPINTGNSEEIRDVNVESLSSPDENRNIKKTTTAQDNLKSIPS